MTAEGEKEKVRDFFWKFDILKVVSERQMCNEMKAMKVKPCLTCGAAVLLSKRWLSITLEENRN